jgi:hypothetical protein
MRHSIFLRKRVSITASVWSGSQRAQWFHAICSAWQMSGAVLSTF